MLADSSFYEPILNSFVLVFVGEMGDKTQLLTLVLAARFKKPFTILAGIFVATLLNHAFASWAGAWAASYISHDMLIWILAIIFFAFAVWILIPDKESGDAKPSRFGPFLTTVIAFFIAEMGDKTQLATVALGARYANTFFVTIGSTFGMLASNALAVFLGPKLLAQVPMQWVRRSAALLFVAFGVALLFTRQ